jgi:hypothetical protein
MEEGRGCAIEEKRVKRGDRGKTRNDENVRGRRGAGHGIDRFVSFQMFRLSFLVFVSFGLRRFGVREPSTES